jgi:tetratricopeptide (TPR) repeat protein
LAERFTRSEVGRILGVEKSRLRYWERLRLVQPLARWGERFYAFGDLVALRAIQRLISHRIPAKRVRKAVVSLERQLGQSPLRIEELKLLEVGRKLAVMPPGARSPLDPITGQWLLPFPSEPGTGQVRAMPAQTPEELFERAIHLEKHLETLPEAVEYYRQVIEVAPHWVEAQINLGVALYQLGHIEQARFAFQMAVRADPLNGICHYNLGCVLEEMDDIDAAVEHLSLAAKAIPTHADVHFNLALAYDKRGERRLAREQWMLYLRYAPNGQFAEQARARLRSITQHNKLNPPIPFPRKA